MNDFDKKRKNEELASKINLARHGIEQAEVGAVWSRGQAAMYKRVLEASWASMNAFCLPSLTGDYSVDHETTVRADRTFPSGVKHVSEGQQTALRSLVDLHLMNAVKFTEYAMTMRSVLRKLDPQGAPIPVPPVPTEEQLAALDRRNGEIRDEALKITKALDIAARALAEHKTYQSRLFHLRENFPATPKLPLFNTGIAHQTQVTLVGGFNSVDGMQVDALIRHVASNISGYERYIESLTEQLVNL